MVCEQVPGSLDEADGFWANCLIHPDSDGPNVVLFHTWGGDDHLLS